MIAVLDACVLYPPSLRDLLLWQAVVKTYEPRWTEEIHSEWMRSVLRNRPDVATDKLERTRRMMDRVSPDCLVTGYEPRITGLKLPDQNDRHVLAAAIHVGASVIVTFNLSDFPIRALKPYGVRAMPPDSFLEALHTDQLARFLRGIQKHRASLKNPPKSVEQYMDSLESMGLRYTASLLAPHIHEM